MVSLYYEIRKVYFAWVFNCCKRPKFLLEFSQPLVVCHGHRKQTIEFLMTNHPIHNLQLTNHFRAKRIGYVDTICIARSGTIADKEKRH